MIMSKMWEKTFGTSFTRTDLNYLQQNLPKLFIKTLKIAKDIDVKKENNTVTIEITKHVFNEICQETRKHKKNIRVNRLPLMQRLSLRPSKSHRQTSNNRKGRTRRRYNKNPIPYNGRSKTATKTIGETRKMQFPLSFWDLGLWIAVTAIILLITAELTSPYNTQANILIDNNKLEKAALTMGILFLITVTIHIYSIITSP